jgi:hypothetical protein
MVQAWAKAKMLFSLSQKCEISSILSNFTGDYFFGNFHDYYPNIIIFAKITFRENNSRVLHIFRENFEGWGEYFRKHFLGKILRSDLLKQIFS